MSNLIGNVLLKVSRCCRQHWSLVVIHHYGVCLASLTPTSPLFELLKNSCLFKAPWHCLSSLAISTQSKHQVHLWLVPFWSSLPSTEKTGTEWSIEDQAVCMMQLSSPWEQNESFLDSGSLKKCSVRRDESCQAFYHSGGWGRGIAINLRPAWAMQWVLS